MPEKAAEARSTFPDGHMAVGSRSRYLTLAFGLSWLATYSASGTECPVPNAFGLKVEAVSGTVRKDYSMTATDIRRAAGPRRAARHSPLLGMVNSALGTMVSVDAKDIEGDDGLACAVPRRITVRIGYEPTIDIAKEAAQDECVQKSVLDHELRHVAADDAAAQRFVPIATPLLRFSVKHLKMDPSVTPALAREKLYSAVRSRLDELVPALTHDADRAQKLVDSPEELLRLRTACGGKGMLLVGSSD